MKTQKCIEKINDALAKGDIEANVDEADLISISIDTDNNSSYMRHQIASVICDVFEKNFIMEKLDIIMNQTRLDNEIIDILYGVKTTYEV